MSSQEFNASHYDYTWVNDLRRAAVAAPADQMVSNSRPHSELAHLLQAVTIPCLALVYVAIAIRIFTRRHIMKTITLEDAAMIVASIGSTIHVSVLLETSSLGPGQNGVNVATANASYKIEKTKYAAQIVYCLSIWAAKLGVLLQIKHLFTGSKKNFIHWGFWTLVWVVSCAYLVVLIMWLFPCNPIKSFRTNGPQGGKCNTEVGMLSGFASFGSDVAILALPIAAIAKLQMCLSKKMGVSAVFGTGIIACIASATRLYFINAGRHSTNRSYWFAILGSCAQAELTAVILCGCFPVFPRFYKHFKSEDRVSTTQYSLPSLRKSGSTERSTKTTEVKAGDNDFDCRIAIVDAAHIV